MPQPLPIDADELNYRIATLLPSTLETVALLVDNPDPDAELYATLVTIAQEAGYVGLLAAWRACAGMAKLCGFTAEQVAALADNIGIQPADDG